MQSAWRLALFMGAVTLPATVSSAQHIYWSRSRCSDMINRSDLDFNHVERLVMQPGSPAGLAVAPDGSKTFWSESFWCPRIAWMALNEPMGHGFIEATGQPGDVEIDWAGGVAYWVDAYAERIFRARLDGAQLEPLVITGQPRRIALDASQTSLYWIASQWNVIIRSDFSGTVLESVVNVNGARDLAIGGGRIFWSEDNSIWRANLDGSNVTLIQSGEPGAFRPNLLALDSNRGRIYWTDRTSGAIQVASLEGTEVADFVQPQASVGGITIDSNAGYLYWIDSGERGRAIFRAALGSAIPAQITPSLSDATTLAVDVLDSKLYWADVDWQNPDDSRVVRSNLDGTGFNEIANPTPGPVVIALDPVGRKIYWNTHGSQSHIQRANLDGSDMEMLVRDLDEHDPVRIALDLKAGHVYWTTWSQRLRRSRLDGSVVEDLIVDLPLRPDRGLAVDPLGGKVYWGDASHTIFRSDLDGSNMETVFEVPDAWQLLSFSLDLVHRRIYRVYLADYSYHVGFRDHLDDASSEQLPAAGLDIRGMAFQYGPSAEPMGCRYVHVLPPHSSLPLAIQIRSPDFPCLVGYVQADGSVGTSPYYFVPTRLADLPLTGGAFVPGVRYDLQLEHADGQVFAIAPFSMAIWGDTVGEFQEGTWTAPNGIVDIVDVLAVVDRFKGLPAAPPMAQVDLYPQSPNGVIDILDIVSCLNAFRGIPYPFGGPCN